MRTPFDGGVAVITGAGAGIGAGLARHAAGLGMTVVLADIDGAAVAALRDELTAAGGAAVDVVCDVRDPDAVELLAESTYRDIGPVRLLVNNAGIEQFGYLWDTPVENWNRVVEINVSGVFHGIRAFVPKMIDTGTSAWVWNLSSIGGVAAVPLQAPYIMSKHAVLALTECLHLEMQHWPATTTSTFRPSFQVRWRPTSLSPPEVSTPAMSPPQSRNAAPCSTSRPTPWIR